MRRPKLAALRRYRPRVLTLALLLVIATLIALANLVSEVGPYLGADRGQAGWPLIWHWHHFLVYPRPNGAVTWEYDSKRLAGNIAVWFVVASASAAACEWLLRRYRPRLRWSLRTMLAGVTLAGVCCGWFAMARNRAELQDPLIAAVRGRSSPQLMYGGGTLMDVPARVWVRRRGLKWFHLVGADRYCRQIVGADIGESPDDESAEQLLARLAHVRQLRYLFFNVYRLTPRMVAALREMPRLEMLSIQVAVVAPETAELLAEALAGKPDLRVLNVICCGADDDDSENPRECLAVIGQTTQLEKLRLACMPIDGGSLESLANLTNLKSLSLAFISPNHIEAEPEPQLLSRLPALAALEALDLGSSQVDDRDLGRLSRFSHLKSLSLTGTEVTGAGLAQLASLPSLEELAIDGDAMSATGLESLLAVKRLARLHLGSNYTGNPTLLAIGDNAGSVNVPEQEHERCVRALESLRRTKPAIVIDTNDDALQWLGPYMLPAEFDRIPGVKCVWALKFLREWNK